MGRLSTHVLDTIHGKPAEGVRIVLTRLGTGMVELIAETATDADGRSGAPLLQGPAFVPGSYELAFHVGDYFRRSGVVLPEPPFLDVVPIRFAIADPDGHYHVPLLVSPWAYSTYRGS